jgi:type II secretory pathway pseudopilin PulG
VNEGDVSARLRSERGMGLIELLIAMTVLQIAIFAVFAMMQAGALSILRSSRVSAATATGERQMELYRGLLYRDVGLSTALIGTAALDATHTGTDGLYAGDNAADATEWNGGTQVDPAAAVPPSVWCASSPPECMPIRTVAGPDGNDYRLDSYVRSVTPASGRPVKRVTVVVRRADDLSAAPLARLTHSFDLATGCVPGSTTNPC